jgi:PAT family beta-lactamase induction signal transducer AmpG
MLGFLMALICSTNDHVIEAYRVKILQENEYKLGVTLSLMAFRLGIMLAGGVGLIYAASFSWQRMYQQAAFIVLSLAISVLFAPTEEKSEQNSLSFHFNMSWNFLKALLNEYHFVGVLSTYRLSVFWLELMMPALLMQFLQLSVFDLGVLYKFYGVIGLLTGGVAVNLFVDQSKIVKALFISLIAQIGVCGLFFLISFFPNVSYEIIGVVVFIECFLQGVLGTVSTIWLMQKTRSDLPAFSFSVWHGLSALGRVWIGPIAAIIIGDFGWRYFTAVGVLLAILSVIICQYHLSMLHQDSHH